jgi:NitT/TauT family transport system substrate-binding protein
MQGGLEMVFKINFKIILIITLVLIILVQGSGCVTGSKTPAGEGHAPVDSKGELSLRVGLMPAVDAAPMLLAEKKGYYSELGLNVSLEMFNNAQNRQSALQAETIDGAMTDFIAVAVNTDGGFDLKAITMTDGMFPVLVSSGALDRKDVRVGMMEVSVSNFLIDEWLGDSYNIEKVFITEIPARLAAIQSGQLDMGLFPEPVASIGELSGLNKKIYEPEDGYCPDVLAFTGKALREKEKALKLFLEAYNRAVEDINKTPQEARDILMEKIPNMVPEVRDLMVLPDYKKASLPDDGYINKVIDWTARTVKRNMQVTADELVERKFVE